MFSLLPIDSVYMDWYRDKSRELKFLKKNSFMTTYLNPKVSFELRGSANSLYRLLQFLSYLRTCQASNSIINGEIYKFISFPLDDFLLAIGQSKVNSYQIQKMREFFNFLQTLPPLEIFAKNYYCTAVHFPSVKVVRKEKLYVEILISEQLYHLVKRLVVNFQPNYFIFHLHH